ncbi:MAG TPA: hypothetical protein VFN96_02460 [Gemmatimonadales bacterium]|nr:hypothetical protein [Gemmatimonadales bacterium]
MSRQKTSFQTRLADGRLVEFHRRPLEEAVPLLASCSGGASPDVPPVNEGVRADRRGLGWTATVLGDGTGVAAVGVLLRDPEDAGTAGVRLAVEAGAQRAALGEMLVSTLQVSALHLRVPHLLIRIGRDDQLMLTLLARKGARLRSETGREIELELPRVTPGRTLVTSGVWAEIDPAAPRREPGRAGPAPSRDEESARRAG